MEFYEKCLSSEQKYKGKIFTVRTDKVLLSNGKQAEREVFEHCGGVTVFALDDKNRCALVKQYRYCIGKEIYELPAGKLDHKNENHRQGAARELREETGMEAESLIYLGEIYPSPGCMTEALHMYFAENLTFKGMQLDEDELLSVEWLEIEKVKQMIKSGEIVDAKTIAGIMLAELKLGEIINRQKR